MNHANELETRARELGGIQIEFKPLSGAADMDPELGFEGVVLGEFSPTTGEFRSRDLIDVNDRNFDQVLKAQNLNLDVEVVIKWGDNTIKEVATISFEQLNDFSPDAILAQLIEKVEVLNVLWQLRRELNNLKNPSQTNMDFIFVLQEAVKEFEASEPEQLEAIIQEMDNRLPPGLIG